MGRGESRSGSLRVARGRRRKRQSEMRVAERVLPMTKWVPPLSERRARGNLSASGSVLPCSGTSARRTLRSGHAARVRRVGISLTGCRRAGSGLSEVLQPVLLSRPSPHHHASRTREICANLQNCCSFSRPSLRRAVTAAGCQRRSCSSLPRAAAGSAGSDEGSPVLTRRAAFEINPHPLAKHVRMSWPSTNAGTPSCHHVRSAAAAIDSS